MSNITGAPKTFDDLKARLVERKDALPKRLSQVAVYAVANPDEIAFGTAATVAEKAKVQPSTLVRFAKNLGYKGFTDLQTVFRRRLQKRWPDYEERLSTLGKRPQQDAGPFSLMEEFVDTSVDSLIRLRDTVDPAALDQGVEALAKARMVYLVAHKRAFPVASYMAYALAKLGIAANLIDNVAGLGTEQLASAGPDDLIVAISFTPYSPATVEMIQEAASNGVPILAITDSPFSPIAGPALAYFEIVEADLGAFRSLSGTFCVAMALCVGAADLQRRHKNPG
ncbi:MAG: MurR/RpiR family transcriptional regulator [Stappiaceae bacterium]